MINVKNTNFHHDDKWHETCFRFIEILQIMFDITSILMKSKTKHLFPQIVHSQYLRLHVAVNFISSNKIDKKISIIKCAIKYIHISNQISSYLSKAVKQIT